MKTQSMELLVAAIGIDAAENWCVSFLIIFRTFCIGNDGLRYCTGNYPPALKKLISKRRDFSQIGDFNRAGGVKSAYQRRIEQEVGSEL